MQSYNLDRQKSELSSLERRKKRIVFRANHRGTQEFDLIIGGFVRSKIDQFDEHMVAKIEDILQESDAQISDWLNGVEQTPDKFQILIDDIKSYTRTMSK